jgi:hypothetical protein
MLTRYKGQLKLKDWAFAIAERSTTRKANQFKSIPFWPANKIPPRHDNSGSGGFPATSTANAPNDDPAVLF